MTCKYCDGTGRVKKAKDEDRYEHYFDRYSSQMGSMSAKERALKIVGYTYESCTHCKKDES